MFEALFAVRDAGRQRAAGRATAGSQHVWECRLMCRVLAYLGSPVLVDELLFGAEVALVGQATEPRMMQLLNLGGFGMAAWDKARRTPRGRSSIAPQACRCSTAT